MVPFDAALVSILLRRMPDARLAATAPSHFQTHPAPVTLKASVLRELIDNERARRRR